MLVRTTALDGLALRDRDAEMAASPRRDPP